MGVLVACQPDGDDASTSAGQSESGVATDVQSPNAKPNVAYLKSRRLDSLTRLGALPGDVGRVAARADGTLDPAAADGRLTLDELLALDRPENLMKLIPAERMALPQLWTLFETTKDAPSEMTVPPIDVILATDVSEPAVEPIEPASIPLSSLKTELQRVAIRLEQAHDSDNNPKTITKEDVAAVLAAPTGFQPWELAQLEAIQGFFRERAGTKLAAKARVTAPAQPPYNIPALLTWGPASIGIAKTVEYKESRGMDLTTGTLTVKLVGHVAQNAKITMPSSNQLLIIDDATGDEKFSPSGVLEIAGGTKTIEVWNGSNRVGSFRSKLPTLAAQDTNLDLSKYADYTFVLEDGKALKHNSLEGMQTPTSFTCSYEYTKDGYDRYVEDVIKLGAANPPFNVAAGRYVLPVSEALGGNVTLELYPEGILKVSRANGWTERAVYQNRVWTLPEGSDLKLTFDPATNTVTIRKADGALIFSGSLTGSLRTG
ncbi:MAG: hypothetical protein U0270_32355 [Labilithrix sp.]